MIWWPFRRQRDTVIDEKITPPTYRFEGFDPELRDRTAARRKAAEGIRRRAAHVDSGEPVSNILRRVK